MHDTKPLFKIKTTVPLRIFLRQPKGNLHGFLKHIEQNQEYKL
jgi:hypothetical protein